MRYSDKILWSFVSVILAALCWISGDIALLGFNVNPADYPLFSKTYANQIDVALAVQMLEGSTSRLMFGALIGALTATLFLPGVWLACQYFKDRSRWYVWATYFILVTSVVLSPLGHAVYFYVGEIFKAIAQTPSVAHPYLLKTAAHFSQTLYIAWTAAISLMMTGWFLFSVFVFLDKTWLPRWMGLLTPACLTLLSLPFYAWLPNSPVKAWIVAASFNLFYFVFFLTLWVFFGGRIKSTQTIRQSV